MKQKSLRARMQAFGGFLTAMVIPNMGAFIAWGFITALFIDTGWMPNKAFSQIVSPMSKYLLPILISFMGGKLVAGDRGGVAGTIGTIGLIIGADIPMFLGAMIMGPLSAWIIKKFDELIEDKAPAGFEMIINNFSLGIIGLILCLLSYSFIGPAIVQAKKTAPGAIIIHFFGGIHEIYFPYVLMKPITILGMIAGSACGIITFSLFNVGLVAGPSPGSIFSYLALTPKGNFVGVIAGVLVATAVSFIVNGLLIKTSKDTDDEELIKSQEKSKAMKQEGKDILEGSNEQAQVSGADIKKVVFACDAGLGSSAMGATSFRKRLEKAGITMDVKNYAIEKVPQDVDVIVTHENLLERAQAANPGIRIVTIQNFLKDQNIEQLYDEIVKNH